MPAPSRILLIRPSALGDVARSVPVLVSLRAAFPGASIDWLVQDAFADVISAHPALSRVVPFPRRAFSGWLSPHRWPAVLAYLRSLSRERYDLVVDAQGLARSALFALASGARERVGLADAREGARLAYTRRVPPGPPVHTVDRMLSLVRAVAGTADSSPEAMRLYTPPHARGFAGALPALAGAPYVVIAPTSRWPAKQWPDPRFASLAESLAADGLRVAVVGAASERPQIPACVRLASSRPGIADLVGSTSIAQLMDVIEHAALVVANDSAALHIAVGFDRPIVALYGPTDAARVGPYRRERDVIQHVRSGERLDHKTPRGASLMLRIGVPEVLAACRARLLARESIAPSHAAPPAASSPASGLPHHAR